MILLSQQICRVSGDETSLLQYPVTWTKLINRGNLFEISDCTFLFFQQVELIVQNSSAISTQHHMNDVQVKDDIFHSVLEAEMFSCTEHPICRHLQTGTL